MPRKRTLEEIKAMDFLKMNGLAWLNVPIRQHSGYCKQYKHKGDIMEVKRLIAREGLIIIGFM